MQDEKGIVNAEGGRKPKKLLDPVRDIMRLKHYSIRTEEAYTGWISRYIVFHNKQHPKEMGVTEIEEFLPHLTVDGKVSASTQNLAFNAILFLYRNVLDSSVEGEWINAIRARRKVNVPVVMTKDEVKKVITLMTGRCPSMAKVLYGGGNAVDSTSPPRRRGSRNP